MQARNRMLQLKDLEREDFRRINAEIQAMQDAEKAACGYHVCHVYPTKRWEYPWAVLEAGPLRGLRVLDAGCGTSPLPCYLASQGAEVYAIDHRDKHMEPQQKAAAVHGVKLVTLQMDIAKLDFPDDYFDIVFCISVLEHVPVAAQAMAAKELGRVLKPEGTLAVSLDFDEQEHAHGNDFIFDRNSLYERFLKPSGLVIEGSTEFGVKDWNTVHHEMNKFTYQPHTSLAMILRKLPAKKWNDEEFITGMNLPWFGERYCNDIGVNPYYSEWGHGFNESEVSATLAEVRELGYNTVRIWLFENAEGLVLNDEYEVTGLCEKFTANLKILQQQLAAHKLKAYWTLLDGNSIHYSGDKALTNILTDEQSRQKFFDKALIPLLDILQPCFAIDLMNEPEACLANNSNKTPLFAWPQLHEFLSDCIQVIRQHSNKFKISCGSGWHGPDFIINGRYEGLNLDFNDFHFYGNAQRLAKSAAISPILPCILGEWHPGNSEDDENVRMPDIAKGFGHLQQLGYKGVFFWHYHAFKKVASRTETARASVVDNI